MARKIHRLTTRAVAAARDPGYIADGNGLYLQVSASGSKSWIFRYRLNGRRTDMGLGPVSLVTLAEAREAAHAARKQLHAGIDPLASRRARKAATAASTAPLFRAVAEELIQQRRAGWRSTRHAEQWASSLEAYAYPVIGDRPVNVIATSDVLDILRPIWTTKTETATRVRQRIEAVLDAATAHGVRKGDNPARWKGHLENLLATPKKIAKRRHFPSMPYTELPAFMALLRQREGFSARALEFTILTAARTNMVLPARRCEDEGHVWRIPAERMKAGIEHEVPLVPAMRALLDQLSGEGEHFFPGQCLSRRGKPYLSTAAMDVILKRLGHGRYTVHGFRSTFKVWASEQTDYPDELSEMALAHAVGDEVKAAYKRTTLLEKRRALMADWAVYCGYPVAEALLVAIAGREPVPVQATAKTTTGSRKGNSLKDRIMHRPVAT